MMPYMMARPALGGVLTPPDDVRRFYEEVVAGKREAMPDYECRDLGGSIAIGVAAAMAMNDSATTGKLHPLTRQALERMWTLQRADGGWDWPFRDTPPLKIDAHYGVTLAAIAAGMAPEGYSKSPAAQQGLAGIRRFLAATRPASLHQRAMLAWASTCVGDLLADQARSAILSQLADAQRADGGWSLASFVDNTCDPPLAQSERAIQAKAAKGYGSQFLVYVGRDGAYQSSLDSDGYATGFAVYVLRQAGVPAGDARVQRGIGWLKTHQRQSGRWFTPSQAWHTQHLIANAGTAFAVLALDACGEIPPPAGAKRGN
jgi:squalene-hopene/tetraprenyl-beta-curcumene cyclase